MPINIPLKEKYLIKKLGEKNGKASTSNSGGGPKGKVSLDRPRVRRISSGVLYVSPDYLAKLAAEQANNEEAA